MPAIHKKFVRGDVEVGDVPVKERRCLCPGFVPTWSSEIYIGKVSLITKAIRTCT